MLSVSKIIEDYRDGQFALDLMEITLTQRAVKTPMIIRGKGGLSLSQTKEVFALRVYSDLPLRPTRDMPIWPGREKLELGRPVPEHHYFNLEATDLNGCRWFSEGIHLRPMPGHGVVFTSELRSLQCKSNLNNWQVEQDWVSLYFPDALPVPFTEYVQRRKTIDGDLLHAGMGLEQAQVRADKHDLVAFLMEKHRNVCQINISAEKGLLAPGAERRANEALSFALAMQVEAPISERYEMDQQLVTLKPPRSMRKGFFEAPVPIDWQEHAHDFWLLVARYFTYTLSGSVCDQPHPLSVHISRALSGSLASLDTASLLVSVGVEGILKLPEFHHVPLPSALRHEKGQKKGISCSNKAKKKDVSPKNKLLALQEGGLLSEPMVATWSTLRNSTAHGDLVTNEQLVDRYVQHCFSVLALLNRLVFMLIGYRGMHMDFSVPGWPMAFFVSRTLAQFEEQWIVDGLHESQTGEGDE